MQRLLALLVVLLTPGCHDSPASPSPTAAPSGPAVLNLVSGETLTPVAGARVTVAGEAYTSDSSGRVFLQAASSDLDIEASDYLERRTLLSGDRFTLWPRSSPTGLDEEGTARLVYGCDAPGCPGGGGPLVRLPRGAAVLVASPELLRDARAMEALEEGARLLTAATHGEVAVDVAAGPRAGAVPVFVKVDRRDAVILAQGAGAVTRREVSARSEIVRATVTFRSRELARRLPLVLHELGHVYGLSHSGRIGDIMWPGPEIYLRHDFSARERLTVALMLQRSPGNRLPDDDRAVHLARSDRQPVTSVIACGD